VTGPLSVGLFVDQFPELSETFISGEVRELARLGHVVHVESAAHAPHPDPAVRADVAYRSDDRRRARLAALAWLVARHPLRCARDLLSRRRWRGEERVVPLRRLAPPARRVARFGATHLHAHFATLSAREREVMALVTAGLMNKQIAAEIGIAEITVKIHRGNIMRKMAAKSLADLVKMAQALDIQRAAPPQ